MNVDWLEWLELNVCDLCSTLWYTSTGEVLVFHGEELGTQHRAALAGAHNASDQRERRRRHRLLAVSVSSADCARLGRRVHIEGCGRGTAEEEVEEAEAAALLALAEAAEAEALGERSSFRTSKF